MMNTPFFSWLMVLVVLKVDCVRTTDEDFKMSKMSSCGYWKFCTEIRKVPIKSLSNEKVNEIFKETHLAFLNERKIKLEKEKEARQRTFDEKKRRKQKEALEMLFLFYPRY